MLLPYLYRVEEWCSPLGLYKVYHSWHHILKQASLMGIPLLVLANKLRVYLGFTNQVDYDGGVLPHDYSGSLMGRSLGNRMG